MILLEICEIPNFIFKAQKVILFSYSLNGFFHVPDVFQNLPIFFHKMSKHTAFLLCAYSYDLSSPKLSQMILDTACICVSFLRDLYVLFACEYAFWLYSPLLRIMSMAQIHEYIDYVWLLWEDWFTFCWINIKDLFLSYNFLVIFLQHWRGSLTCFFRQFPRLYV